MEKTTKKILVIRFSSIGDIVLTTPVIRCLKEQLPGAEVHFLTKNVFHRVLEANPNITKIYLLDQKLSNLIPSLKKEKYDFIVDLHKNIRTLIVKTRLNVRSGTFEKLNYEKWLLTNMRINRLPDIHIVDRYFQAVNGLNVQNDGEGLDYYIPDEDGIDIKLLPDMCQKGFIALSIGGKHNTKRMPPEMLAEICTKVDYPFLLMGGREDFTYGEKAIAQSHNKNIYNACGNFNINQSASLIRQSQAVVTHDTGLMHIAAAFKKKIVSIWGNTVPEFGMYPYLPGKFNDHVVISEVKGLKCRPCSKIGFKKCPKKHFDCMKKQDLEWIAGKIKGLI